MHQKREEKLVSEETFEEFRNSHKSKQTVETDMPNRNSMSLFDTQSNGVKVKEDFQTNLEAER